MFIYVNLYLTTILICTCIPYKSAIKVILNQSMSIFIVNRSTI